MNLPTKITVVRLILTVFILFLIWDPLYSYLGFNFPQYSFNGVIVHLNYLIAGVIFIIASLTDWLDGYLARKYNVSTFFGSIMDSVCDKIIMIVACTVLYNLNPYMLYAIICEVLIFIVGEFIEYIFSDIGFFLFIAE